jgi:hypothetical protein
LIGLFMFLYWNLDVRKRFRGPTPADASELARIESGTAIDHRG